MFLETRLPACGFPGAGFRLVRRGATRALDRYQRAIFAQASSLSSATRAPHGRHPPGPCLFARPAATTPAAATYLDWSKAVPAPARGGGLKDPGPGDAAPAEPTGRLIVRFRAGTSTASRDQPRSEAGLTYVADVALLNAELAEPAAAGCSRRWCVSMPTRRSSSSSPRSAHAPGWADERGALRSAMVAPQHRSGHRDLRRGSGRRHERPRGVGDHHRPHGPRGGRAG